MASSCKNHKALEQTYVAKQRRQLCSLSFQTLNPFPCRHPVLRVYHESYQEREREPAWDATLNGTSSTTHSNAGLRLGTKSNHWQAFEWVAELVLFSLRTADVSPRSCDAEGRFTRRNSVDQLALLTGFRTDFASSVWNFCRWVADFSPRETSLSGDGRGESLPFAG